MWYYLCFILIFQTFKCEEVATFQNETVSDVSNFKNKSIEQNNTVELQRITQPSDQSQHIERALTSVSRNLSSDRVKSEFKPSPHLETYYEFNKFPVPPALPEAKHFPQFNFGEYPFQSPDNSFTTEQPWTSRIKFPTTQSVPTTKDRPYSFYNYEKTSTGKSYNLPSKSDSFVGQPLDKIPTIDSWNNFMNHHKKQELIQKNQELIQKNQFDFTAPVERPEHGGVTEGGALKSTLDLGAIDKPPQHDLHGNPWKKIIKFLTAFIPIGLLISALTPTVITVQSMNGTQARSRAENSRNHPSNKLISSLNYFNSIGCEDRILCELVLSASATQNAEQHVENLLNTFTQEGKAVERAEEMRRIFEAVKKQDCRPIICKNIKEKT